MPRARAPLPASRRVGCRVLTLRLDYPSWILWYAITFHDDGTWVVGHRTCAGGRRGDWLCASHPLETFCRSLNVKCKNVEGVKIVDCSLCAGIRVELGILGCTGIALNFRVGNVILEGHLID